MLDELDSENNELPIEYAGNVVSNLSYVVPPQVFTEYFVSLVPLLKKLMVIIFNFMCFRIKILIMDFFYQLKSSSDILRATGLAIIGESAKGLGENATDLTEIMFSLIIPLVDDEDDSVRNNAVFALGELVFYGKQSTYKLVFKLSYIFIILNNIISYR